jgi:hypothetical protein
MRPKSRTKRQQWKWTGVEAVNFLCTVSRKVTKLEFLLAITQGTFNLEYGIFNDRNH